MRYDVSDIKSFTAFRLANEAECACPDSDTSAGATFLTSVRDATVDLLESQDEPAQAPDDLTDEVHQIADDAPDVYTYTRWMEFVDLAAWQEEVSEYGEIEDMTQAAAVALYMIAERLARALAEQAWVEDEDEGTEDEDEVTHGMVASI